MKNSKKGMTYIELIVVLSIFSIMSSIALFQYRDFQTVVDLKNFSNEIALKINQAQLNSVNGKLIEGISTPDLWTPSYGVKFALSANTKFAYYVNVNNYDDPCSTGSCVPPFNPPYHGTNPNEKVISVFTLNKSFYISDIRAVGTVQGSGCPPEPGVSISDVEFRFVRPSATPIFYVTTPIPNCSFVQYVNIILSSPNGTKTTKIRMHATGQIQLI